MPRPKHTIWSHFFSITKAEETNDNVRSMKNTKHKAAWCYACLDFWINNEVPGSTHDLGDVSCFLGPETTQRTYRRAALAHIPSIRGVPGDLVKHLLDCPNVSDKVKDGLNVPSRDTDGQIQDHPPQQTILRLTPVTREFTPAQKKDFKRDILRLIVGLNIAFTKADHPQMEEFCAKWIGLNPPSRRVLTSSLLQEEKAAVEAKNTDILVGQRGGTLVCDGWNNSKRQHLVSFMLLTRQQAIPLHHFDNSGVSRTGQLAYQQILQVLESLKVKEVDVYGVCTDDGPDQSKARKLLLESHPHIISIPCWAHQVNLLVKSLLTKVPIIENTDVKMNVLVRFFRSHDQVIAMLQREMELTGQKVVVLLRPVLTRWTSHFVACRRLNKVKKAIRALVIRRREEIVEAVSKSRGKGNNGINETLIIIEDDVFWAHLYVMQRMLEPLAVAALTLQADTTRLDTVLLTLGKLYTEYQQIYKDSELEVEKVSCLAILSSLEKRWKPADQDLFVTAVILNPFIGQQRLCFNHIIPQWQRNGLYKVLSRVYKKLFCEEAPDSLLEEWLAYRNREGNYTKNELKLQYFLNKAILLKQSPDPVAVWRAVDDDECPLIRLALRVFSYCPNSAALERLFSQEKDIESIKRSSFHHNTVADVALVATDINSSHRQNRKRKYGTKDYTGDLFLSTKLQCLMDEFGDKVDKSSAPGLDPRLLEGEARSRGWFQDLANEYDDFVEPNEDTTSMPLTLEMLFDVQSSSELINNLNTYMEQQWAVGDNMMEAETAYYTALLDPYSTAPEPVYPTVE